MVVENVGLIEGLKENIQNVENTLQNIWGVLESTAKFCKSVYDIVANPIQTIVNIADASYWIFLLTAIICLILTIAGCKKTKNGAMISFILYIIVQCFAKVLRNYV